MTLAALPDTDAVPGPFWLLSALHLLTFVLHLLAMSALVGTTSVLLAVRAPDRWARPAVRRLLALLPTLMAATVTLGVAPLLFLQLSYGRVAYAAAITSAVPWILVPFLAMAAYGALYAASRRPAGDARAGAWLRVALGGLVLVSLVYASTFALAERPDAYGRLYRATASGLVLNPDVATWGPRWLQAFASAVALGSFVAARVARADDAVAAAARRTLLGAVAVAAVAALLRVGVLDPSLRAALGGAGIGVFVAGALAPLAAAALLRRGAAVAAGALLVVGLVLSVVARHLARLGALSGAFDPAAPAVRPQHDVFAIFVVCLLVAAGVIVWMLRLWSRAERPDRVGP